MLRSIPIGLFLTLVASSLAHSQQSWKVEQQKNEMNDQVSSVVSIKANGSTDGDGATLGITCSSKRVDAWIDTYGSALLPASSGTIGAGNEIVLDRWGGYPAVDVWLRFDQKKQSGPEGWVLPTTRAMQSRSSKWLVKVLMKSSMFRVQYRALSGEYRVLTFQVSGLMDALQTVKDCKIP
jgi:hypothetical protein